MTRHTVSVEGLRGQTSLSFDPPVKQEVADAVRLKIADEIDTDTITSGTEVAHIDVQDDSVEIEYTTGATGLEPQRPDPDATGSRRSGSSPSFDIGPGQGTLTGGPADGGGSDPAEQTTLGDSPPDDTQPSRRSSSTQSGARDRGQLSLTDAAETRRLDTFSDDSDDGDADDQA